MKVKVHFEIEITDDKIAAYFKSNPWKIAKAVSLLIALPVMLKFDVKLLDLAIIYFFLISALYRIESRYSFGAALALLVIIPLLLSFNNEVLAEVYAVYAYYFLVIGTILSVIEFKREEKEGRIKMKISKIRELKEINA